MSQRHKALTRRIPVRTAVAFAIAMAMIGCGGGTAVALWSTQAALASSAGAATLRVSMASTGLTHNYSNGDETAEGTVSVSNQGTAPASYSITAAVTATFPGLPGAVQLVAQRLAGATCPATPPAVVAGSWAALPAALSNVAIAVGEIQQWCVYTTLTGNTYGGESLSVELAAVLSAGSWTVSSAASFVSQTVGNADPPPQPIDTTARYALVHDASNSCADASVLAAVVLAPCGTPAPGTQQWTLAAAAADFNTISPVPEPTTALQSTGNNTPVTRAVVTGAPSQQWQVQARPDGRVQLYNPDAKRCLAAADTSLVVQKCDATIADQGFRLVALP